MFDPVCGIELAEDRRFSSEASGQTYGFCTQSCKDDFLSDPARYVEMEPLIRLERVFKTYDLGEV